MDAAYLEKAKATLSDYLMVRFCFYNSSLNASEGSKAKEKIKASKKTIMLTNSNFFYSFSQTENLVFTICKTTNEEIKASQKNHHHVSRFILLYSFSQSQTFVFKIFKATTDEQTIDS